MKSFIVTIDAKSRITLPQHALEHLGMVGGGTVYTKKAPDGSVLLSAKKFTESNVVRASVQKRKKRSAKR